MNHPIETRPESGLPGAMPTALRGHALGKAHAHAKPWAWHPNRSTLTRIPGALAVLALTAGLAAAGILPPLPRIPAEALKPAAKPAEPDAAEDPAAIADRIAKNTKAAADRLKDQDTGADTRKTQDQTLKDIDALLKKAENPPPMGGGGGDSDMNKDMNKDMDKQGGGGGGGGQKPMGGQQPKGGGQKQAGGQQQSKSGSWQERRQQERGSAQKQGGNEKQQASGKDQQPAPDPNNRENKQPGAGATAGGNDVGRPSGTATSLPLDEMTRKQVWGHLPEKLRQQMSQYYKEQFMPKYGDLLRQYYASLAEREKAKKK